jgi:hypothetical protein
MSACVAKKEATHAHFKPKTGFAYDTGSIDPHLGASYRLGSQFALQANFDHINVAQRPSKPTALIRIGSVFKLAN